MHDDAVRIVIIYIYIYIMHAVQLSIGSDTDYACCVMQLFSFADRFRGLYDDAIPSARQFYTSSGYSVSTLTSYFNSYHVASCMLVPGAGRGGL